MAEAGDLEEALGGPGGKLDQAGELLDQGKGQEALALAREAREEIARIYAAHGRATDKEAVARLGEIDRNIEAWEEQVSRGSGGEASADDESGAPSGGGCGGTVVLALIIGAVLYFGFGVGKSDHKKRDAGSINASTATCRDIGLGNPETPEGKRLKENPKKAAAVASQLSTRGFGHQGTEEQRRKAMLEAIAFVCVTAKSPDVGIAGPALAFAKRANPLAANGGQGSEEQTASEIEKAFQEEVGSQLGGFAYYNCTRFSDTRYVCEGSGSYQGAHYDRLWDAEVAPDGTVAFSPKG